MKTRKVLLAFLLLICIISTSVFAVSASADSENTVYATTSSTVQQGSYAYLYVYIEDLTDLASLTVSVYYDTDKVEVVSTYNSVSCSLYDSSNKDGCVQYSYIFSGEGSETQTQLFYVYYKVKDNAEAGNTYFDIIVTDAYNSGLEAMPLSGSRCSFEVKEKAVSKSCSIYSSSTVSTSVKEEFDITYRLSTYQIASGSFYIQYDQEVFEVVSVTSGSFLNGKITDVNSGLAGSVYVSFVGTEYNTNTQLVTVRFRTIKNTSESSDIKFVSTSFYDLDLNNVSCSGYTTKVNVSYDETYVDDLPAMFLSASYSADTQETTLVIKLDKDSNLGAGDFVLTFNSEYFEYVSSTKGFAPSFFNINERLVSEGTLKFSIISMTDITDEQIVLTVKFTSSLFCQDITPKFEINGSGLADSMTNPIMLNLTGTSILVEGVGHNLVENVTLYPTCTEPGQKKLSCTRCDYYEFEEISALGHDEISHSAKDPTCTEFGWNDYVTCSRCDYTTYNELAALGHTVVIDPAVEPTCAETGLTEGSHCSVCSEILIPQNEIDALGHRVLVDGRVWVDSITTTNDTTYPFDFADGVYSSTNKTNSTSSVFTITALYSCELNITYSVSSEQNYDKLIINRNGTTVANISGLVSWQTQTITLSASDVVTITYRKDGSVDKNEDTAWFYFTCTQTQVGTMVEAPADSVEPTCTESVTCYVCKEIVKEAKGHNLSTWYEILSPTCTKEGVEQSDCTDCDYSETKSIPANGHTSGVPVTENRVEPDCVTDGRYDQVIYCTICNEELSRENKVIDKLGHDHSTEWTVDIAPTCTTVGSKSHHCLRCDEKSDITEIPANGHNFSNWSETLSPTCTEEGIERRTCSVCGHLETRKVPAKGHTSGIPVVENQVEPDCTTEGNYDYVTYCSVCNEELSREGKTITKLGHNEVLHNAKAPTCTDCGWTSYVTCTRCDYTTYEVINALGHDEILHSAKNTTCTEYGWYAYVTCSRCDYTTYEGIAAYGHTISGWIVDVEATYEEDGKKHKECTICGVILEESIIPMLKHSFVSIVTKPTCTENGYTTHTCEHCGETYVDDFIPSTGHNFSNWSETFSPTCTEEGTERRTCYVCDHFETRDIPANGHTSGVPVVENRVEPDCTTGGSYDYVIYCSICDKELYREEKVIAKLGHNYSVEWSVDIDSTCTITGSMSHHCIRCDDKADITEIPAKGHSFAAWNEILSPTCTEDGIDRRDCEKCDVYETRNVSKLGHSKVYHDVKAPTCTEPGWNAYETCAKCNYTTYEKLDTIEHTSGQPIVENEIAPGCENTGSYDNVIYCAECSEELSREKITVNPLGHSYGDWCEVTAPTCTDEGLERRDCVRCDSFETNVVSALGHTYAPSITAPTCTEEGYTTYTCHCGDSYVDTYVDALGHRPGEAVIENVIEPTCTASGSCDNVVYCKVCGIELNREAVVIEAAGHSYNAWVKIVAPSCESGGVERRECINCKKYETRDVAPLGHQWVEEDHYIVCGFCGEIIELETDHSECEASLFETIINAIINFFRILFGLPEVCVCGEELQ